MIRLKSWIKADRLTHLHWSLKKHSIPLPMNFSNANGYGIRGKILLWIDSFLCSRQQRVVINGAKSKQGTVLGALLFSLYINDIMVYIDSESRLFADDCVSYRQIHGIEDTVKLQRDINRLGRWARKWNMGSSPPNAI